MWTPDAAYVISLPVRLDRHASLRAQLPKLGFPVQRHDAHDGVASPPPAYRFYSESDAAWGASRSHVAVLDRAIAAGAGTVLVLEDDVVVPEDFAERMDQLLDLAPPDWEALMLGGEHARPAHPHAPGVERCTMCIRTHAYVLRGGAIADMRTLIDLTPRHYDISMARTLGMRRRTYAPAPFLLRHSGSPSSIPDSNHASPVRLVLGDQ